jgi:hypothetical protein
VVGLVKRCIWMQCTCQSAAKYLSVSYNLKELCEAPLATTSASYLYASRRWSEVRTKVDQGGPKDSGGPPPAEPPPFADGLTPDPVVHPGGESAQRVWTISGPAEVTPLCRGAKAAKVGRDRTTWRKLNARWR